MVDVIFNDIFIVFILSVDKTKLRFAPNNLSASFTSTAKIEGNQLIIEVFEIYKAINYPIEFYQEYRNVINAASDFSKASVVLKPKK